MFRVRTFRTSIYLVTLGLVILALAACGRGSSGALADETDLDPPTPTVAPVPTFTPTPVPPALQEDTEPADTEPAAVPADDAASDEEDSAGVEAETVDLAELLAPTATPASVAQAVTTTAATEEGTGENAEDNAETLEAEADPVTGPNVTISVEAANIRSGPGIPYDLVGAANQGDQFEIVARNPQGDWWQICCIGEQTGWIFGPLVEAGNADSVAVAAEIPPLPTPEPAELAAAEPVALPEEPQPEVVEAEVAEEAPAPEPAAPAPAAAPPGQPAPTDGTAGNFDPNAQYQIVHFRTLGFEDNNGGIFNKGGQQLIFVTVLDGAGNAMDGAVVKNALADNLTVTTGSKGPGKAEIKMDWDPYKLFVAQDGSGPVTSQVSNQMNNPYPHIPDVVGMLGPPDNEYAICPTPDDRCDPPFYHAHWSYEITFQKVR